MAECSLIGQIVKQMGQRKKTIFHQMFQCIRVLYLKPVLSFDYSVYLRKITLLVLHYVHVRRSPGTKSVDSGHLAPVTDVAADVPHRSRTSYSSRGVSFANLIPVSVQASTATSSPPHAIEDQKGTVL